LLVQARAQHLSFEGWSVTERRRTASGREIMRQPPGLILLLAVLAPHQVIAQSSSSATIFLLDAEPQTVEASVIAYTSISGQNPITTLLLSCLSTFAPCISASIDGATAYHTQGSVFGGTLPGAIPTTFYCELGSGSGDTIPDQNGQCNQTVGSETISTVMNSAYVSAHQAAMIITAGLEKLSVSATSCSSRRQLFSTSLPYPSSGTTAEDVWGWAAECPSTTSVPSTMSSQTVSQTSSQSSQTLSQTSPPVTTSPSASSSSAASTETKASGASARIVGSFMFAQLIGVAVVWVIL